MLLKTNKVRINWIVVVRKFQLIYILLVTGMEAAHSGLKENSHYQNFWITKYQILQSDVKNIKYLEVTLSLPLEANNQ